MAEAQEAITAGERSRPVEWRRVRKAASWVEERRFSNIREKAREISEGETFGWVVGEERRLRRSEIDMGVGEAAGAFDEAMLNGLRSPDTISQLRGALRR
jgi:hypothetical protein